MTVFSRRQIEELKWVSVLLFVAALYNVVWGVMAAIAPVEMLALLGVSSSTYVEYWQCIGMFVAL
jgi:small multidrug resistance pump